MSQYVKRALRLRYRVHQTEFQDLKHPQLRNKNRYDDVEVGVLTAVVL
jgi:hypothetical protein